MRDERRPGLDGPGRMVKSREFGPQNFRIIGLRRKKNGHVLGLEKSFFLSPLHHDVYSCSRASLLPFRVVNHGGLTLY